MVLPGSIYFYNTIFCCLRQYIIFLLCSIVGLVNVLHHTNTVFVPQVRGTSLVWAACVAVLTRCCLPAVIATPMEDVAYTPWVPFPPEHHVARSLLPARMQERVEVDAANTRMKRVFLSRGWGPGGYDAPAPQPPQRYVRRPPLPQSSGEADMGRPFESPQPLRGKPAWCGCVTIDP